MTADRSISPGTRVRLTLRDYAAVIAVVVGMVVYMERRLAVTEEAMKLALARIAALENERGETRQDIKDLLRNVNDIRVDVAKMSRNPSS